MPKTGKCLCGAVTWTIAADELAGGVCHCAMCRAWTVGIFVSVEGKPDQVTLTGEDHIGRYASSEWAERCFCKTCGSSLFYRVTAPGPYAGVYHFGAGGLAAWDGVSLDHELYIDRKPEAYALAGAGRKQMTEAEVMALFAPPEGGA